MAQDKPNEPERLVDAIMEAAEGLEDLLSLPIESWPDHPWPDGADWPNRIHRARERVERMDALLDDLEDEWRKAVGQSTPSGLVLIPADFAAARRVLRRMEQEARSAGGGEMGVFWQSLAAGVRRDLFTD